MQMLSPLYKMVWYLHITYAQPPLPVYFKSALGYLIQYKCHVKVAGAWHIRVCFRNFLESPPTPPTSIFNLWLKVEPEDMEAADTEAYCNE